MKITIIYLENEMLISKKQYDSWREIQDEYPGFKTSLGPWSEEDVVSYLTSEYPRLNPKAPEQAASLLDGEDVSLTLEFE